jgi:hypothetical protein
MSAKQSTDKETRPMKTMMLISIALMLGCGGSSGGVDSAQCNDIKVEIEHALSVSGASYSTMYCQQHPTENKCPEFLAACGPDATLN